MTRRLDGTWATDSMSNRDCAYVVDVDAGTCTCPHFTIRLAGTGQACKHLTAVREHLAANAPTAFGTALERAQRLTDEQLRFWLAEHQKAGNAAIQSAILNEMARRQAAAIRDAELRSIFS